MTNQPRIPAPNYTQTPNAIFELMADKDAGLTEKELKVLLAIVRKTFGWHKKRDKISLTQLEELTSLSRPSVIAGLESAIKRGIVRRTPDKNDKRGGVFYELVVEDIDQSSQLTSKDFEPVKNINQSKELTRTSKDFEPELVKNLNTQKKDSKEIKETPTPPATQTTKNDGGGVEIEKHLPVPYSPDPMYRMLRSFKIGASDQLVKIFRERCPSLDVETVRQSIENQLADKVTIGAIVKWLREDPPEPGKPYPRVVARASPVPTRPIIPADMLTPAQIAERTRAKRAERDTS